MDTKRRRAPRATLVPGAPAEHGVLPWGYQMAARTADEHETRKTWRPLWKVLSPRTPRLERHAGDACLER
jgi:hypothetical protein